MFMSKVSHVLLWIVVCGTIVSIAVSGYRFLVQRDYILEYEASCDPTTERCFVRTCEDAESFEFCTPGNYKVVKKYAHDIKASCGTDVRMCTTAPVCLETDRVCEITYCDESVSEVPCTQTSGE